MNKENLKILADYLMSLPEDYQQFHMSHLFFGETGFPYAPQSAYFTDKHCRTVACALGHGPSAGLKPEKREDWYDYCERVFGFSFDSDYFTWLFASDWDVIDNTHHGAAKRIYYAIENGIPENFREQTEGEVELCY